MNKSLLRQIFRKATRVGAWIKGFIALGVVAAVGTAVGVPLGLKYGQTTASPSVDSVGKDQLCTIVLCYFSNVQSSSHMLERAESI